MKTGIVAGRLNRHVRGSSLVGASVRLGLMAYGGVHLLVAYVAVRLALGAGTGSATGQGALAQLAGDSGGRAVLMATAIGFAALVLWQLLMAAVGFRDRSGWGRTAMRAAAAFRAAVYGYLAVVAARLGLAGSSSAGGSPDSTTSRLMGLPAGALLVGVIGVTVAAIGLGLAIFGIRRQFLPQLDWKARTARRRIPIVVLGQVGYVVKGLAYVLIGTLLTWAGISEDPHRVGGLDRTVQTLLGDTLGQPAMFVLAGGIACFGCYLLALARHLDSESLTSAP